MTRRLRFGLLIGLGLSFIAAIGMVERFSERVLIEPILNMGILALILFPATLGYLAARGEPNPLEEPQYSLGRGSTDGLVVGLLGGAIAAAFVLLIDLVDVSRFLPNMRQSTVEAMTFGFDLVPGMLALIAIGGLFGALGGAVVGLDSGLQRLLRVTGLWVLGLAFFQGVVTDVVDFAPAIGRLIYASGGGLEWYIAIAIAAIVFWVSRQYEGRVAGFAKTVTEAEKGSQLRRIVIIAAIVGVIVLPMVLGTIINELLVNVMLFVLMGLGLNIVVGYAGLLDLGYVAFFAVGAYGTAVLTSALSPTITPELAWFVALPIVVVLAAIAGLLVGTPVIRMRGDYLAIVTLGFGEIVRILLLSDWLTPIFGGAQGIRRIPGIQVGPWDVSGVDPQLFVYLAVLFAGLAAYISYRAQNSRIGRAWAAMREDEDVAEATGISTVRAKLLAFVTGAIVASFAGALFSAKVGAVFTNSFDVIVSIIILVVVIVGGMGSIKGVILGAFVLIGGLGGPKSPGLLAEFAEYKLLIYGAILIYMMLARPEGLIPSVQRSRELHKDELTQDAWFDKGGDFGQEPAETSA